MLEIPTPEIFQAIVDRIETGVYVLDLNQKVMYWNYGAQKITGFLSQEMLGRACGEHILGNLRMLLQPAELIIIGGAAIGTVLVANPMHILKKIAGGIGSVFGGSKWTQQRYLR